MMKWVWRFLGNIIRTLSWLPVIWKDCDWDYRFFFNLLEYKLGRMKKEQERGFGIYDYKRAEKIEYALKLLRRINSDPYSDIAFRFHDEKWGEIEIQFDDTDETSQINFRRDGVITKEDEKQERIGFDRCSRMEGYLEHQDIDILFRFLTKHIRDWWT